jgi:hypothetical protein
VRRLVEGPGTPGARPRLVVLCVGNGARGTNFPGRPPSSHRVVERALTDVPNVALVRTHEAGTTKVRLSSWRGGGRLRTLMLWGRAWYGLTRWAAQYLPDERFAAQPRLALARPVPETQHARGLRMAPTSGIIFNRDAMSGTYAPPAASDALCPLMDGWAVQHTSTAKAILMQACRAPARIIAALDAVAARPAFRALLAPPALAQRAAWVADLAARQPPAPATTPDAMAAYVLEPPS